MQIDVQNLRFTYPGGVEALQGLSLSIETAERVAIVGQNGSGKTTLVKHFNGLLKPTEGIVRVGEWETHEHSVAQMASRVGYVFQNPDEQLFKKTVRDEIAFGPINLGYESADVERLTNDAIDLADLEGKEEENPYDLSATWRKMIAMASIVAMDSDVVIFDEPTTGQDAVNIARMSRIIHTLTERGKTVVTITHDIDFCAENFERMIVMGQGKILLDGPLNEVIAEDQVLATTYVDPPQLTRLAKRLNFSRVVKNQEEFLVELDQIKSGD
jgi:energy-coupling factor transport system ATP-binding protein